MFPMEPRDEITGTSNKKTGANARHQHVSLPPHLNTIRLVLNTHTQTCVKGKMCSLAADMNLTSR